MKRLYLYVLTTFLSINAVSDKESETALSTKRDSSIIATHEHISTSDIRYDIDTFSVAIEQSESNAPTRPDSRTSMLIKSINKRKLQIALIGLAGTTITTTGALVYTIIRCESNK